MPDLELNNLPVIDRDLGKQLAGNQSDLAEEMIAMLRKSLPQELADIQAAAAKKQYHELSRLIHKLHGAVAYCGTPRLKAALKQIEMQLRQESYVGVDKMLAQLQVEVEAVIEG